jgi:hypothetical protein
MTSKAHPNQDRIGMLAGLAATALIALLPAPVVAQTGGIPGVVAPGVESELVQEGFTFTSARRTAASTSPTSGSTAFSISMLPARSPLHARTPTAPTASR